MIYRLLHAYLTVLLNPDILLIQDVVYKIRFVRKYCRSRCLTVFLLHYYCLFNQGLRVDAVTSYGL